jgi:ribonuclease BN (tRNA processing enzyme)
MPVTVRFVGSGDAFGSGGRFQTCILVDAPGIRFAIDFGASSLIALAQQGIEHNSIDVILLTHLHGDHCGGVPFLLVDADLLIAECYFHTKPVKWHLNYPEIAVHGKDFGARRVILTHLSREMLAHASGIHEECAHDGLVVEI